MAVRFLADDPAERRSSATQQARRDEPEKKFDLKRELTQSPSTPIDPRVRSRQPVWEGGDLLAPADNVARDTARVGEPVEEDCHPEDHRPDGCAFPR